MRTSWLWATVIVTQIAASAAVSSAQTGRAEPSAVEAEKAIIAQISNGPTYHPAGADRFYFQQSEDDKFHGTVVVLFEDGRVTLFSWPWFQESASGTWVRGGNLYTLSIKTPSGVVRAQLPADKTHKSLNIRIAPPRYLPDGVFEIIRPDGTAAAPVRPGSAGAGPERCDLASLAMRWKYVGFSASPPNGMDVRFGNDAKVSDQPVCKKASMRIRSTNDRSQICCTAYSADGIVDFAAYLFGDGTVAMTDYRQIIFKMRKVN